MTSHCVWDIGSSLQGSAHRFAVEVARVLHKDVTPFNQWMVLHAATAEAAVPEWQGAIPPPPRQAQLGDFGLGFKQDGFQAMIDDAPSTTTPVVPGDGGGTGFLVEAPNSTVREQREELLRNRPHLAMDRSVSNLIGC
jgi:hypothetical protein